MKEADWPRIIPAELFECGEVWRDGVVVGVCELPLCHEGVVHMEKSNDLDPRYRLFTT